MRQTGDASASIQVIEGELKGYFKTLKKVEKKVEKFFNPTTRLLRGHSQGHFERSQLSTEALSKGP